MKKAITTNAYGLTIFLLLLTFFNNPAFCQKKILGVVLDQDHQPVEGASIAIKNSTAGTVTAANGSFSLMVRAGDILVVSSVGMIGKEVSITNQPQLIIRLTFADVTMEDVVVIGYGTSKKKDLTGAVASVSTRDFNKGIYTSPDQLIQGKVSGIQITNNNGQPGGAATIKIRGNSSLSGTGQPLFVVDGVPLDGRTLQAGINPLNFINPDDIVSIDVLKDASATAIYGARAAYGVMIINTKKGQKGQPKITGGISTGISSILKKVEVLNASEFREAIQYYGVNSSFDKGGNTDALDAILQNGFQSNYTTGFSGGNENGKYRVSGNVLNNDGILKFSRFKKYGIELSTSFKFLESKKLGLDINLNSGQYIQDGSIGIQFDPSNGTQSLLGTEAGSILFNALKWNPTDSLRNADGTYRRIHDGNPLAQLELMRNNLKVTTILGSVSPYFKITDWLEYKLLFSINYSAAIIRSSVHQDVIPPGQPPGLATVRNNELITRQFAHTLTFNRELFTDLKLNAVAGFEYTNFKRKGFSASGNGVQGTGFGNFGLDYTNYIQYSDLIGRSISSYADPTSDLQSYFGRTIFNYKDKYLLTATLRADGSSKFGENNRFGYFPSFAAAWIINKEKFFKIDFINSLKLRAGWGKTGNQEFPAGSAQARYSYFDGGFLRQVNNPNPDLKWQSDRQYNLGLDFSIFSNRISGTLDYFNKATTNLLFPSPPIQPAPPDAAVTWKNLDGEIRNKGLEVLINTSLIRRKDFGIDVSINATFLKNNVSGLPAPVYTGYIGGATQVIENGFPINTFFTRKFIGIDKATGFSNYADSGATFYHVGDANPKTLLGINPVIHYKKLSLSANLYGAFGQNIYFTPLMSALNVGGISVGSNIGSSIFKSPVKESLANPSQSHSSRFIFKGNYLKMASITLNYNLGTVKKVLKEANIYVTGQNLFIITKYPGFDPEINSDRSIKGIPSLGIDFLEYPSSRTIIFGINFLL